MAQKAILENAQVGKTTNSDYIYDLNDTFLSSMYKESDQKTSRVCLPEKQDFDQNAPLIQDKDLIESSIHVSNKQDLSTKTLLTVPRRYFFCGSFMFLFCLVFAMFCARLFICASWSPAGKGLTSWLSFVVSSVSLSLSRWYPGSGVVLDCIDS